MRAAVVERSPLRIGVLVTLTSFGFAGVAGLIAVFDADSVSSGFGRGLGVSVVVFLAGATVACALACLARGRAELVSVGSIAAAGLALDLLVVAVWRGIDSESYAKITGVAFVWGFFALVALALTLAVKPMEPPARVLYGAALGAAVLAAALATWLIATAGNVEIAPGLVPASETSDDELLRVLGAALVVLAALWFSALAASRLERGPA
jgi:hypothetical protein